MRPPAARFTPEQPRRGVVWVLSDLSDFGNECLRVLAIDSDTQIPRHTACLARHVILLAVYNPMDYTLTTLTTITELPEYIRRAAALLSAEECKAVIDHLAADPKAGDVMEGTGGIRKLRWGRGSKGKSGGVRVIYYYHDRRIPLYLLTVFGKNEQANLGRAERNQLAKLVDLLVKSALENNHG
jgi:hypothetical protein